MTKQEYNFIRILALDILADSKCRSLPIDINAIARTNNAIHLLDKSKSFYENAICISNNILISYGLNNLELPIQLAVRILAPIIVLQKIRIKSAEELETITQLPTDLATQRYKQVQSLVQQNKFETSKLESLVLSQFQNWINLHH